MASTFRVRARLLANVAAPILFAAALSACSSIPDWVDPTTWIGGGSQASSDQTSDAGAGAAQPADAGQTPDIASIPPKPVPPSTTEEQKQVADSLEADRAQAHYSADALRGGEEAAAPPPSAQATPTADTGTSPSTTTIPSADQTASSPPSAPPADQAATTAAAAPPPDTAAPGSGSSTPRTASADNTEGSEPTQPTAAQPTNAAGAGPPAPAPNQVASTDNASAAAPAAAPLAAETATPPVASAPDMQASFAPSRAPALDPSVAHFVPEQILSRYQETAAAAAAPGVRGEPAVAPAKHRHHKKARTSQARFRRRHLALDISPPGRRAEI